MARRWTQHRVDWGGSYPGKAPTQQRNATKTTLWWVDVFESANQTNWFGESTFGVFGENFGESREIQSVKECLEKVR